MAELEESRKEFGDMIINHGLTCRACGNWFMKPKDGECPSCGSINWDDTELVESEKNDD